MSTYVSLWNGALFFFSQRRLKDQRIKIQMHGFLLGLWEWVGFLQGSQLWSPSPDLVPGQPSRFLPKNGAVGLVESIAPYRSIPGCRKGFQGDIWIGKTRWAGKLSDISWGAWQQRSWYRENIDVGMGKEWETWLEDVTGLMTNDFLGESGYPDHLSPAFLL